MYGIEWTSKATRQLRKINDKKTRLTVIHGVEQLSNWPNCKQVKKLKGSPLYRLRIGQWRVIFDAKAQFRIIQIEEVKQRNEQTY